MRSPEADKAACALVTEFACAERLMNAAIHMVLTEQDWMAIRIVSQAAYNRLKKAQKSRQLTNGFDPILRGLSCLARDFAGGTALPKEIEGTQLERLIGIFGRKFACDAPSAEADPVLPEPFSYFWAQFDRPHYHPASARKDCVSQNADDISTRCLLMRTCELYSAAMMCTTGEMDAYELYVYGCDCALSPLHLDPESMTAFSILKPAKRRALCISLLRQAKKDEAKNAALLRESNRVKMEAASQVLGCTDGPGSAAWS